MIARVWYGRSTPDNANDYVIHLREMVFPKLETIDGHEGAYILRRDEGGAVEFGVITLWNSMAAIRAFAGDDAEVAVVPPQAQRLLADYDRSVKHYEIIERD